MDLHSTEANATFAIFITVYLQQLHLKPLQQDSSGPCLTVYVVTVNFEAA